MSYLASIRSNIFIEILVHQSREYIFMCKSSYCFHNRVSLTFGSFHKIFPTESIEKNLFESAATSLCAARLLFCWSNRLRPLQRSAHNEWLLKIDTFFFWGFLLLYFSIFQKEEMSYRLAPNTFFTSVYSANLHFSIVFWAAHSPNSNIEKL